MILTFTPLHFVLLHLFVFALSVITALLEIQIEGPHGWAERLPTWRFGPRWFKTIFNRTEITGYHLYLMIMILLLLHFPLFLMGWSWMMECAILSCYFFYNILWDFLWFVLNPAYGWCRYSKNNIWWFSRWFGPFPMDYYMAVLMSAGLAILAGSSPGASGIPIFRTLSFPVQYLIGWILGFLVSVMATMLIVKNYKCRITTSHTERAQILTITPVDSES